MAMGSSSSAASVGDNLTPNPLDIQRAMFCSVCTYEGFENCRKELEEGRYPALGFTKVFLGAQEQGTAHNLVLAIASDDSNALGSSRTLFVALRGTKSLQDFLTDLDTRHKSFEHGLGFFSGAVKGKFHSGFYKRISEQLPDMVYFKTFMLAEKIERVVFCGHSLGGALAHMSLLKYMVRLQELHEQFRHISVAFGPPHFCDRKAKEFLKEKRLEERMFTFVNELDPIPLLLNNMPMTIAATVKHIKNYTRSLSQLSEWFFAKKPIAEDRTVRRWANDLAGLRRAIVSAIEDRQKVFHYVPVGRYHRLDQTKTITSLNDYDIISQPILIDPETLQCHRTGAYLLKLVEPACSEVMLPPPLVKKVYPVIESCVMSITGRREEDREAWIHIKGKDLFLPFKWGVSGLMDGCWTLEMCEESTLVLKFRKELSPGVLSLLTSNGEGESAFSMSIETCFGKTKEHKVHLRNPWYGSCVQSLFSRAIGKMLLMKSCDLHADYGESAMEQLRLVIPDFSLESGNNELHLSKRILWEKFILPTMQTLTYPVRLEKIAKNRLPPEAMFEISIYGIVVFHAVRPGKLIVRTLEYSDVLNLIIFHLTGQSEEPGKEASHYEMKIYGHIKDKGAQFGSTSELPREVAEDLSERAQIIYHILSANEHLERLKTVMFIGPENAGKSTLINCVAGKDLSKTGHMFHTGRVQPYKIEDNVIIVDLPGTEAAGNREEMSKAWKELEHVPDLCVVVEPFLGDTSHTAAELPKQARQLLCDNVVLVVNGVDRVLHGSKEARVWSDYSKEAMESRRLAFAEQAGLPTRNVFMAVSAESRELEATTLRYIKERGVMLREDITLALRNRIFEGRHDHNAAPPIRSSKSIMSGTALANLLMAVALAAVASVILKYYLTGRTEGTPQVP